jgi:hypothetical protein
MVRGFAPAYPLGPACAMQSARAVGGRLVGGGGSGSEPGADAGGGALAVVRVRDRSRRRCVVVAFCAGMEARQDRLTAAICYKCPSR